MTEAPPPSGHNAEVPLEVAELRAEVARLRQALREAKRWEGRGEDALKLERLRQQGQLAVTEGRMAEVRVDAGVAWDKVAAVTSELGRVLAEGVTRLRLSQATVDLVERANAALVAGQATIIAREAELRTIVDSAVGLAILATDLDGHVLFWNVGAERLLTLDPDHTSPLTFAEVAPFEDGPDGTIGSAVAQALQGKQISAEAWPLWHGAKRLWIGVEAMPLGEVGAVAPAGVLWLMRDCTDAHTAVLALRESEARFRHMADSAPALIWMTDADGQVTFANMHYDHVFGRPASELLGQGWKEVILPEDFDRYRTSFREAFHARTRFRSEVRVRDGSGQVRWLRCEGVPRLDDAGRFLGYTGCNVDITEARLAADELERRVAERTAELMAAEETLRHAQKMEAVGQLTGGIAHDFNNMLQGVTGSLGMARRRVTEGRSDAALRYLDTVQAAAERAAGLTRRLLAFARRRPLETKQVDTDVLTAGLADMIRRTIGPAITLDLQLRDGAGSVLCDPGELESALLNLCINARDAMPDGGRLTIKTENLRPTAAEISDDGVAPGLYVALSVTDTGTGMSPEVLERVFEPFFTTKPLGQGTGLGLSQVWSFARQSGGLVRAESTPGQGTTVRLLLPLQEYASATERPAPAAVPEGGGEVGTVLLVDDEDAVRQPAADRLRELGHTVLEARNGPEALQTLAIIHPDLLVTDIGLPDGMNGQQLAEAVRGEFPGLPVLFMTGYAGTSPPPGVDVIEKPFELDVLTRRVRAILQAVRQAAASKDPGG